MKTRRIFALGDSSSGFMRTGVELLFEPRDLYVGVFWNVGGGPSFRVLDIFVVLVPGFPIHIWWPWWRSAA